MVWQREDGGGLLLGRHVDKTTRRENLNGFGVLRWRLYSFWPGRLHLAGGPEAHRGGLVGGHGGTALGMGGDIEPGLGAVLAGDHQDS